MSSSDFVAPLGEIRGELISGRGHYERVLGAIREAKLSVWIGTANLKELRVEPQGGTGRRRWPSVLHVFEELLGRGVEMRVLHGALPSRPFQEALEAQEELLRRGLELRLCPRVHLKTVIVDASFAYLGSANWTGAGLGAKGCDRRNFELGLVTDDDGAIDRIQGLFHRIWSGRYCDTCRVRHVCPEPLRQS